MAAQQVRYYFSKKGIIKNVSPASLAHLLMKYRAVRCREVIITKRISGEFRLVPHIPPDSILYARHRELNRTESDGEVKSVSVCLKSAKS